MPTHRVRITAEEDLRDRTGGTTWVWPEESPAPFFKYSPPQRGPGSGEEEKAKLALLDFDLEALPKLGPEVDHFLQELAGSLEEEDRNRSSPEPLVEEYES